MCNACSSQSINSELFTTTAHSSSLFIQSFAMYYFAAFVLLGTAVTVARSDSLNFDSDADDCCSLTWEPVIDAGGRRFIPSTAIPFGEHESDNLKMTSKIFFARKLDIDGNIVGAIDDQIRGTVYIYISAAGPRDGLWWTDTYVLANPHNCDVEWYDNSGRQEKWPMTGTAALEFPSIGTRLFAKSPPGAVLYTYGGESADGFDLAVSPWQFKTYEQYQVLGIDCASSLRKTLEAELFDIEFDTQTLLDKSQQLKVLSSTEVINDSDFDQEATIDLESEVLSSLRMSHDVQLYSMMDTKWGVHASAKAGWLGKMMGLSVSVDGGYDAHSLKTNFTRTGTVAFDSQRKQFKYKENIVVKARTKTKVTMNTQPIGGSQHFKAHYRISSTKANSNVTFNHVANSLRRQGFAGWDQLKRDDSGNIVFTVDGDMEVDAGVDTHILIESTPLSDNSSSFKYTSRIVKGLDQLSLPKETTT